MVAEHPQECVVSPGRHAAGGSGLVRRLPLRHARGSHPTGSTAATSAATSGIALRSFRPEDAPALSSATFDPEILRFTFMPERMDERSAQEWIARSEARWATGSARFAIVEAGAQELLLGMVGMVTNPTLVSGEAFYWVLPGHRGRGLASSALGLLAGWAFDVVGVERLCLLISPDNAASAAVALRCGFCREGVLRAYQPFQGGRPDVVCWSLLPADPRPWGGW